MDVQIHPLQIMKQMLMTLVASMVFGIAAAQLEPKTNQQQTSDTIVPPATNKSPDEIANKGILHRNTIESGVGKPDNIKRKLNDPPTPTQPNIPRVKTDTTTPKRVLKPIRN
jgi:hypothetical protein